MAGPELSADDYFSCYCDLEVHELMLKDRPRTNFYRQFFETHRDFVKGKVVMDVGAGTGILSLFAATAGAKKVYAVEASGIASICREIVADNKFESVIEVIHGAVEDISLIDGHCIDILVSEWMGFYLLHESMLDSVLVARDKFLAPDGVVVPSRACLYMAPVDMSEHFQERADYWSNIYGYDFSPIASSVNMKEVSKPLIKTINPNTVKAEASKLLDLDLKTMSVDDVKSFSKSCIFPMSEESRIHGFATWFDVSFDGKCLSGNSYDADIKTRNLANNEELRQTSLVDSSGDIKLKSNATNHCDTRSVDKDIVSNNSSTSRPPSDLNVSLSTSPFSPATHWKQTVLFLPQTIMVMEDILLCCKMKMSQDLVNKRFYNISIVLKDESDLLESDDDAGNCIEDRDFPSDEDNSEDSTEHTVPCGCGSNRCHLIAALVEKYDTEHQELVEEAEMVETKAEVEAAKEIDTAIETEGWSLDMSGTDGVDNK